jgi:tryptophan synthase alpha subunit
VVVGSALVDCVASDYSSNGDAATVLETANSLISTIRTGVNLATSK